MNVRKIADAVKAVLGGAVALALLGGLGNEIVGAWVHRNEPVYLVSQAYDPIWRKAGFIPADITCFSPVRCEPNGKPQMRYFVLLKEHQVRQWGLDPAQETPVQGDPFS